MARKINITFYIKENRQKRGFTQVQLAEMLGISPKRLSHIENGEICPDFRLVAEIADWLDTPFLNLFVVNHIPPINPFRPHHDHNKK